MNSYIFFVIAMFLALVYAFWNGANDRANSIATVVKTRVLSYWQATIFAGILNFAGPLFSTAVAVTIAKGIVPLAYITPEIVLGGLVGAIFWAAFATRKGIPVSITHSLIGGVMGAGVVAWQSTGILAWDMLLSKVFLAIVLSPLAGFVFGFLLLLICKWVSYPIRMSQYTANRFWRGGQLISSSWLSFSHGMNDGQNAVGIIALAYFAAGFSNSITITWWMIGASALAIGLGTAIAGWRVMHTMGWRIITELEPVDGFAAEISASAVLTFSSLVGMPVSTTHVAVAGILGAGGAKNMRAVNWIITSRIIAAWFTTIPVAAIVGAAAYMIVDFGL